MLSFHCTNLPAGHTQGITHLTTAAAEHYSQYDTIYHIQTLLVSRIKITTPLALPVFTLNQNRPSTLSALVTNTAAKDIQPET